MTSTECTAMFLTKLREISEKWCQAKVPPPVEKKHGKNKRKRIIRGDAPCPKRWISLDVLGCNTAFRGSKVRKNCKMTTCSTEVRWIKFLKVTNCQVLHHDLFQSISGNPVKAIGLGFIDTRAIAAATDSERSCAQILRFSVLLGYIV